MTDDQLKMLAELLRYDPDEGQRRLTRFEIGFIERFNTQGRRWDMTEPQENKLKEIWEKIYG